MTQAASMAGRKRKPGVARTKSGRISHAQGAYQEDAVGIEARARLFGLSKDDAKDPRSGSVVGRLAMMGQQLGGISPGCLDAANKYREQRDAYRKALSAPDSLTNASRGGADAPDEGELAKQCASAIQAFDSTQRVLVAENGEPSNRHHNLLAAMDYIVIRNQDFPHMRDALRVALNCLVRYYGLRH